MPMARMNINQNPAVAEWGRTLANEWHNGKSFGAPAALEQADCIAQAEALVKTERGAYGDSEKCPYVGEAGRLEAIELADKDCGARPDPGSALGFEGFDQLTLEEKLVASIAIANYRKEKVA